MPTTPHHEPDRRAHVGRLALIATFAMVLIAGHSFRAGAEVSQNMPSLVIRDGRQQQDDLRPMIRRASGFNAKGDLDAAEVAWREIREAFPNHPAGFVLAVDTLHWRKTADFMCTDYDPEIQSLAERAIELADAWLERSAKSPEALLYKGQALVSLMKLNGMQGHYFRAGTQGEAGREALEEALRLNPELADAKLSLGTYYYYASIATRYIRWLTWLWFVPTGEHDMGLAYVVEAATDGDLLKFEAMAQLSRIYLYNEEMPEKAKPIVAELAAQYPENSYFQFEQLEVLLMLGDYPGAIAAALPLEAGENRYFGDARRRQAARIWRARAQMLLGNISQADAILDTPGLDPEALHHWELRWALVTQGNLDDLSGSRENAVRGYRRVVQLKTRWGSDRSVQAAQEGIDAPFRLSVDQANLPSVGLAPHETP